MQSLIRMLRGINELETLEQLMAEDVYGSMVREQKPVGKRVRDSGKKDSDFVWGDEK